MRYCDIIRKTVEVYVDCNIHRFPVDCVAIVKAYGYKVFTYSYVQYEFPRLYECCRSYSQDSFKHTGFRFVIYNDRCTDGRIRFSLAHEIGHIIMGHTNETPEQEDAANTFAGYLLAPCIMIEHYHCRNSEDVRNKFNLSMTSANIAWQNYRRWKRHGPCTEDLELRNWILYLRRPVEVTDNNMFSVNLMDTYNGPLPPVGSANLRSAPYHPIDSQHTQPETAAHQQVPQPGPTAILPDSVLASTGSMQSYESTPKYTKEQRERIELRKKQIKARRKKLHTAYEKAYQEAEYRYHHMGSDYFAGSENSWLYD